jgi:leucine-rich repeat protein SHOC2
MQSESERAEIELSQWLIEQEVEWDGKLADLQKLDLSGNELTSLPESLGQLINLQGLALDYNKLTSLPEWLGQLTNLQWLYLSDNELTSLPESVGQLTNLQELNLWFNKLTSLPESLGQLTNLQSLALGYNKLTSLPESVGQLTNLQELNLWFNKLTSLPESISQLTNLQSLKLYSNELTSLPESISQLTNLQILNLRSCQLTSLPESISQLTNLQKLYLEGNELTSLSPLQALTQKNLSVYFLGANLPRRYWTKFSDWQPEWLLDENNAEIRRIIIEQVGYERICTELGASTVDTWREYTLLKTDNIEAVYDGNYYYDYDEPPTDWEPMVLLKMTCPSTEHVHILRVPPEMTSAEAAVTWVNHGIHPDKFAVQT